MPLMVLMLDVSKLSGWLKTFACWRVTRRANDVRGEVRPERWEGGGAVQTQVVCTGRGPNDSRAERTWNILLMSVTLDVSKLSGWLNADARCRVERRACDVERGVRRKAAGRGPAAAHTRRVHGKRGRL